MRNFMKKRRLMTAAISLLLVFTVIFSIDITAVEIYGYDNNVEYFLPNDSCDDIKIEIVSENEMEQIREAAEINQKLIEESLSSQKRVPSRTQYKFGSDYFYNQMTDDEKILYDNIVSACNDFLKSTADLTQKKENDYVLAHVPYSNLSFQTAVDVSYAVYLSNPQFYFLEPTTTGYYGTSLAIAILIPSEFASSATRNSYYTRIQTLTDEWMKEINRYSTDIEKERCIYKKLCDYITYEKVGHHQTIAGSLANGKSVCSGYAMAMTYFCSAVGIDCVYVKGHNHGWNRVKLDGKWYEVDTTWMDQKSYIWGDWCNKSTYSFKTHIQEDGSHTLDEMHTQNMFSVPNCSEDYPECSPHINAILKEPTCTEYGRKSNECTECYWQTSWNNETIPKLDHSYIWKSDSREHWQECEYNCGTKKDSSTHTKSAGYLSDAEHHWLVCTNPNCGTQLDEMEHTYLNGVCIECGYRNSLYGDVNNDGYIDNTDLLLLRSHLSDISLEYDSDLDINGDGFVDNLDLLNLRHILSGLTV